MRIALMSYRSKPHCGGQGVYVRHLSRELVALGHTVEVFSGQPYPELDEGVSLTKVPSLDLYREPDPFRTPRPKEFRDLIDVEEVLTMWTAGFPEPKTFSKRVARLLKGRRGDFDIVHDNQTRRVRHARHRRAGLPADHHDPSPDHVRPSHRHRQRADAAQEAQPASLVRLPGHAEEGRPAAPQDPHGLRVQPARHHHRLRGRPVAARGHHARCRRRVRPADRPSRSRADRRDGQRGCPDEGHRHAAGGVRQAAHRARRRAAARHDAQARWPHRAAHRRAGHRRRRAGSSTASATPSSSTSWVRPRSPACRRCTKASPSRPPSSWPARRRWSSAGPARSPRSSATTARARSSCRPATSESSRPRSSSCWTTRSDAPRWAAPVVERVLEKFSWRAVAAATAAAYEEVIAASAASAPEEKNHADR